MSVNGEIFAKSPCDECAAHLIMISFKISKRSEFAQTFVLSENKLKKKQPPQLNGPSGSLTHFYQLGAFLLRKRVKCHSPIQQLFSASSSFVFFFIYLFLFFFQLYMFLFGYDFNNLKQRQAEYFVFIEILTSVLTIQSYLFLSLNFF